MLPYLRLILFVLGAAFFILLGSTAEGFIIEVLRRLIPIDPGNQIFYNALNIAASVAPLLGVGLLLHLAIGSERGKKELLWVIVSGIVLAVIAYSAYQIAWVIKAGSEPKPWQAPLSPFQLYFYGKTLPCLIIGLTSFLPLLFYKSNLKISMIISICIVTFSMFWLLLTGKLQVLLYIKGDIMAGFVTALIFNFLAVFLASKMELM